MPWWLRAWIEAGRDLNSWRIHGSMTRARTASFGAHARCVFRQSVSLLVARLFYGVIPVQAAIKSA